MGTTALTAAWSKCQPHACHVSVAVDRVRWGGAAVGGSCIKAAGEEEEDEWIEFRLHGVMKQFLSQRARDCPAVFTSLGFSQLFFFCHIQNKWLNDNLLYKVTSYAVCVCFVLAKVRVTHGNLLFHPSFGSPPPPYLNTDVNRKQTSDTLKCKR